MINLDRMNYSRTEQVLEEAIKCLEELAVKSALATSGGLESMLGKLRSMRRSMQRLDKTNPAARRKFWMLSRRSVVLALEITRKLSTS